MQCDILSYTSCSKSFWNRNQFKFYSITETKWCSRCYFLIVSFLFFRSLVFVLVLLCVFTFRCFPSSVILMHWALWFSMSKSKGFSRLVYAFRLEDDWWCRTNKCRHLPFHLRWHITWFEQSIFVCWRKKLFSHRNYNVLCKFMYIFLLFLFGFVSFHLLVIRVKHIWNSKHFYQHVHWVCWPSWAWQCKPFELYCMKRTLWNLFDRTWKNKCFFDTFSERT